MKTAFLGFFAVSVAVAAAGCASTDIDEGAREAASAVVSCPLAEGTAGACSSNLTVTDPLRLGAATLTWEQSISLDRAGAFLSGQETITARDAAGGVVAQLVRSFTSPDEGEIDVWVGGNVGATYWDTSGTFIRDSISGDPGLHAVNLWLSDAPDAPTELKESCNWSGNNCLCQCETDWPWDHAICAATKLAAVANGECALLGWWYCQNDMGGAKCGNKP